MYGHQAHVARPGTFCKELNTLLQKKKNWFKKELWFLPPHPHPQTTQLTLRGYNKNKDNEPGNQKRRDYRSNKKGYRDYQ